jgi:WD40 repeat protein
MVFSRNVIDTLPVGKVAASSSAPVKGPATAVTGVTAPVQNYDSFVTLQGHTKGIFGMVQLSDGRICSAGSDNDLRVWSRDMKSCEKVLKGHTNSVGNNVITSAVA